MNEQQLLTIESLARILCVKESRIRSAVFRKEIPYLKIGRLIRFNPSEIEHWMKGTSSGNKKAN